MSLPSRVASPRLIRFQHSQSSRRAWIVTCPIWSSAAVARGCPSSEIRKSCAVKAAPRKDIADANNVKAVVSTWHITSPEVLGASCWVHAGVGNIANDSSWTKEFEFQFGIQPSTSQTTIGAEIITWDIVSIFVQKPGDHPNFRKNALGVKRPFSELSESSGVFSEQLSEFEIPFSEYEIPFSEWHPTTWAIRKPQFSEQLPERFRMKDFHLPLHSRSFFSRIGVVPARKNCYVIHYIVLHQINSIWF